MSFTRPLETRLRARIDDLILELGKRELRIGLLERELNRLQRTAKDRQQRRAAQHSAMTEAEHFHAAGAPYRPRSEGSHRTTNRKD